MTTIHEPTLAAIGPERLQGQGLDPEQYESGDRAIQVLLTDPVAGPQTHRKQRALRKRRRDGLGIPHDRASLIRRWSLRMPPSQRS